MTNIQPFLEYLQKHKDDRGLYADLRHGFSEGTEYRAWPHIACWCRLEKPKERKIWTTIAAGYAVHKKTADAGNLGWTMNRLVGKDMLKTFEARFRRLLTCETVDELCDRLPGIIKASERKGVPVNFEQLYLDLTRWEYPEREIKIKWAAQYWGADKI